MKLGANPEFGFNAVANAEPGLTPLSKVWITFVDLLSTREGRSPNLT